MFSYIRSVRQQRKIQSINQYICSFVSSEAGTRSSVLCSSVQTKTEQLACFAQACCLQKHNGGAMGGNLQIKGRWYYKIPFLHHRGCEIEAANFFHKLAEKGLPKKITGLFFFSFSGLVDAPGTWLYHLNTEKVTFSSYVTFNSFHICKYFFRHSTEASFTSLWSTT